MKQLHQTGLFLLLLVTALVLILGPARWRTPPPAQPSFDLLAAAPSPNLNHAETVAEPPSAPEAEPALLPVSLQLPAPEPASVAPAEPAMLMVPRSPTGESTMMRTWKLASWPALLALTAAPVLGQQPAEPDKNTVEILKRIDTLQKALETQIKQVQADQMTDRLGLTKANQDLDQLKQTVDQLRKDVDSLKATATTRVAMSPSTTTGRIRLVNDYPQEMRVVVNQLSYPLQPGEERVLEAQPAGTFVYQVLGVQPTLQTRLLTANQTYVIRVYPR